MPGHEVVTEVVALGPAARGVEVGQRMVLNPWLSCAPRGIEPLCPPCQAGDLNLCWSFTKGDISPGVHIGVVTGAPGAWAELLATHASMLIPVPDDVSETAAVLADPFSVSFHAILRNPRRPAGKVVVVGAGALGLASVAILSALYPEVEVAVVARFPVQFEMARAFGASLVLPTSPAWPWSRPWPSGRVASCTAAFDGLPMAHPGHIDVVYDTVGQAGDLRGGRAGAGRAGPSRLHRRGRPGPVGVDPVYFKELTIVGSNAFAMEEFEGVRKHAIEHYLSLVQAGRIDLTGMVDPPLSRSRTGGTRSRRWPVPADSGVVKAAFAPNRD